MYNVIKYDENIVKQRIQILKKNVFFQTNV